MALSTRANGQTTRRRSSTISKKPSKISQNSLPNGCAPAPVLALLQTGIAGTKSTLQTQRLTHTQEANSQEQFFLSTAPTQVSCHSLLAPAKLTTLTSGTAISQWKTWTNRWPIWIPIIRPRQQTSQKVSKPSPAMLNLALTATVCATPVSSITSRLSTAVSLPKTASMELRKLSARSLSPLAFFWLFRSPSPSLHTSLHGPCAADAALPRKPRTIGSENKQSKNWTIHLGRFEWRWKAIFGFS